MERPATALQPFNHSSKGLQHLLQSLPAREGLSILDLGDINQANVSYFTGLGHRHFSEDLLLSFNSIWPNYDPRDWDPLAAGQFTEGLLDFPENQFDAALIWETFQFLPQPAADFVLRRLLSLVKPDGFLLGMFHSEARQPRLMAHSYRIEDDRTLRLVPQGLRPVSQTFSNRSLEQLFADCRSMKFFLSRDNLKEVIVKR